MPWTDLFPDNLLQIWECVLWMRDVPTGYAQLAVLFWLTVEMMGHEAWPVGMGHSRCHEGCTCFWFLPGCSASFLQSCDESCPPMPAIMKSVIHSPHSRLKFPQKLWAKINFSLSCLCHMFCQSNKESHCYMSYGINSFPISQTEVLNQCQNVTAFAISKV